MRTIFLLLLAASSASAQTNLVTFTNVAGTVFKNVRIIKHEPDGVTYFFSDGAGGGKAFFRDLPDSARAMFGYDAEAERQFEHQKAIKLEKEHERARKEALINENSARWQIARETCINGRRYIGGKVIQVLSKGLLVESGPPTIAMGPGEWVKHGTHWYSSSKSYEMEADDPSALAHGILLLTDTPKTPTVADGDYIFIEAYPCGTFSYTNVQSSKKVIRKFTCNLDTAIKIAFGSDK